MTSKRAISQLISGTGLLFLSYSAAQTFVPVIFARAGKMWLGILALFLIYGFMILGSVLSNKVIDRYGSAAVLRISPLGYILFLIAVATSSPMFVICASIFLGLCAGMFWTANTMYLLSQVDARYRGRASGYLWAVQASSSVVGIILFGYMQHMYGVVPALTAVGIIGCGGVAILAFAPAAPPAPPVKRSVLRAAHVRPYRSAAYLAAAGPFLQGFSVGLIPLAADALGKEALVSTMGAIAYALPALIALCAGSVIDLWGLRKTTVLFAVLAISASCVLMAAASTPWLIVGGILLAAAIGVYQPLISTYPSGVPANDLSSVNGLLWTARALGVTLSLGILLFTKSSWLYGLAGVTVAIATVAVLTERTLFTKAKVPV